MWAPEFLLAPIRNSLMGSVLTHHSKTPVKHIGWLYVLKSWHLTENHIGNPFNALVTKKILKEFGGLKHNPQFTKGSKSVAVPKDIQIRPFLYPVNWNMGEILAFLA